MATNPLCQYLPEGVIQQILVKIPCTKSILRCTIVCKLWYFLIKSSQFINTHLSDPNNTKYLLCQHTSPHDESVSEYSLCSDTKPSSNFATLVCPHELEHVKVHGCCNGVICCTKLGETRGSIYLWNPFVRKLKVLPKFREKRYRKEAKEAIGFWFDKEKSDYEVVKISYTTVTSSVNLYSLRRNSWKIISDSCPGTPFSIREHNVVYAKGTLHWLAEERQGWRIVSLDMSNGKFREALIITTSGTDGLYLTVGNDNSLVILRRNGLGCVCTVKVHEESLELFYTDVDPNFSHHLFLLGFRNNGEALLRLSKFALFQLPKDMIILYDAGAEQFTVYFFTSKTLFSALPFVETLVLLDE